MIGSTTAICSRGKKFRHLGYNFKSIDIIFSSALRDGVKIRKVSFGRKFLKFILGGPHFGDCRLSKRHIKRISYVTESKGHVRNKNRQVNFL
jgi:hypothetical protein